MKTKVSLDQAQVMAEYVYNLLSPYCENIKIAGSVRRGKPEVGDIEIVLIPKRMAKANKRGVRPPVMGFIELVNGWERIKGDAWDKALSRTVYMPAWNGYPELSMQVDIFTADVNNWGYILAIRTGSSDYSHKVLANGWVKKGYKGVDGYLTKNGEMVPVQSEAELFNLIGIEYCIPKNRNYEKAS